VYGVSFLGVQCAVSVILSSIENLVQELRINSLSHEYHPSKSYPDLCGTGSALLYKTNP
jgi:hypothetical protein